MKQPSDFLDKFFEPDSSYQEAEAAVREAMLYVLHLIAAKHCTPCRLGEKPEHVAGKWRHSTNASVPAGRNNCLCTAGSVHDMMEEIK